MVLFEQNLLDNFSKVWLNMKLLFGSTPVVWCTPWNQSVSSKLKMLLYLSSSYELVKSEYSFSKSSILVFKVINAFYFNMIIVRLHYTLFLVSLVDLLDLLKLDLLSSLFLSLLVLVIFFYNVEFGELSVSIWRIVFL